ncbi:transposase [Myxococcus xanthus]|nr:transposase [Myxococcus xanthus]
MKEQLVPDEPWVRMAPLLPPRRPHRKGGRPWADDRAALRGILFVLKTGIAWRDLPAEAFQVSGF